MSEPTAPLRHVLKIHPEFYVAVADGTKTFEVRKDDRQYQVGDRLLLLEWAPEAGHFTGRLIEAVVSYKMDADVGLNGSPVILKGFCILGLGKVTER